MDQQASELHIPIIIPEPMVFCVEWEEYEGEVSAHIYVTKKSYFEKNGCYDDQGTEVPEGLQPFEGRFGFDEVAESLWKYVDIDGEEQDWREARQWLLDLGFTETSPPSEMD